jgi:predicted ATPase
LKDDPRATVPNPQSAIHNPPSKGGTLTFLLTEVESSTVAGDRDGDAFKAVLDRCHWLLRQAVEPQGGREVRDLGDGWLFAFPRAGDALRAAIAGQQAVSGVQAFGRSGVQEDRPEHLNPPSLRGAPGTPEHLKVRMALHTGDVGPEDADHHGPVLHCAERILLAAHGGQILCSEETAGLLRRDLEPGAGARSAGPVPGRGAGRRLIDLGAYRLGGTGGASAGLPERLFQVECPVLGQHSFPPPRAAVASGGHLPLQLTRFFGREHEIEQVRELLSGNAARLITLTGPAGSGKSRLALQAAQRLQEPLPRTTWFVPLVDLADPCLIPAKLLEVLRLPHSPQPEPVEQVISFLSRQPSLLILDNFEHLVLEGAPLVQRLLERVPTLTCLVTSRQRLGLPGEQELPVPPLPVPVEGSGTREAGGLRVEGPTKTASTDPSTLNPQLSTLAHCASVQLFTDRAQAVRPDFQVTPANMAAVAALCARLEGLPLALELAAARAQMLTPQQMLARLDQHEGARLDMLTSRHRGTDPRHQSLRAMLDWSYQLLTPELQQFFAHLSVFRGGFTLEAASAVADGEVHPQMSQISAEGRGGLSLDSPSSAKSATSADQNPIRNPDALDCLEQLRECSLVLAEECGETMRYRILETLREFGAEQLSPEQQPGVAGRHAAFYCALAEEAEPELLGAGQPVWLKRLEQEHDNLRAALGWAVGPRQLSVRSKTDNRQLTTDNWQLTTDHWQLTTGLRLAGALWEFWASQGHVAEGRDHLEKLLRLPGAEARTLARAKALACVGILADFQGDFAAARALHEEGLAIRRALGDQWGVAFSLTAMGFVAQHQGDYGAARLLQEESLSIWRALGNELGVAWSLNSLADVAGHEGDFAGASSRLRESLTLRRAQGDQWGAAFALSGLGTMALYQGDLAAARGFYEESLAVRRGLGDRRGIATSLANMGYVALRQGGLEEARSLLDESLAIQQELGDQWGVADALSGLGHVACRQGDWAAARSLLAEGLALRRALGDREGSVTCLEGLAVVAGAKSQTERAGRLFGAAATLREARSAPLPPPDRTYYERHVTAARAALGETAFAAAWNTGRALTWEQAVAAALGEE